MKLHESTKIKAVKDKNNKNVPHLEITEVVLAHCDIVNNDYEGVSRVLYNFVPNKSFGKLLDISPKFFIFLKPFNSNFSYIEVSFSDQNYKSLEIQDKIIIPLVIS